MYTVFNGGHNASSNDYIDRNENIINYPSDSYNNFNKLDIISNNYNKIHSSPAQIRTGVKGSKGLYAWPLHSAEKLFPPPGFRTIMSYKLLEL